MCKLKNLLCDVACNNELAIEKLKKIKQKEEIILFGAGISGMTILTFLRKNEVEPVAFCDNNKAKVGKIIKGIEVVNFSTLSKEYGNAFIVIFCDAYREITEQLTQSGFHEENMMFFDPDWVRNPEGEKKYIYEHLQEFEEVYSLLEDQKSRDVFVALLNYKISHCLEYIKPIADSNMYFDHTLIKFKQDENFVDVGAYIGDTLQEFLEACNGCYGHVICMEPNVENISALETMIREKNLKEVDVYPVGASDKKQTLTFTTESDIASKISKEGTEKINCDTIDNICFDKYNHIDLIKMDIEGSEYYALKGAQKVIQRDHPKLAICVYHKEDDFFKLPILMKELYPGYKLYFRQYELSAEETVCYAIP